MSILVVAALKEELGSHFNDVPVCYTGVGKVNAAYRLTLEIREEIREKGSPYKLIVNFGTACGHKSTAAQLVNCTAISQRDMDCMPLGYEFNVTPFEDVPKVLTLPDRVPGLDTVHCFTGDTFITGVPTVMNTVCDMEAYALAKVCFFEKIPFVCVKYISDSGSADEWRSNCGKAGKMFREVYERLSKSYS